MTPRWFLAAPVLAACAALSGGAAPATGPSFDCAKAATKVEKTICANADLAALDRRMAARYADALAGSPTPVTLRARQRAFLADRARDADGGMTGPENAATLADRYRAQLETLQVEIDANRRGAAVALPAGQLGTRCAVIGIASCRVEAAGTVAGSAPYGRLLWQTQVGTGDDEFRRGMVVLRDTGGVLRPVMWNYEGDHHEAPAVVATPDGPLLVLSAVHGGTGVLNADLVFRPVKGGWRDLDVDAWRRPFDAKLPAELGVWKGVIYDWPMLTLDTALWKAADANCCPTGGSASARLTVQGDALALKSMTFDRKPPRDQ